MLIAVAEAAPADPLSAILAYGPLGVMVFLFVIGKLRTEGEVKRLEAECGRKDEIIRLKDEQIAKQSDALVQTAIPAVVRATQALDRIANGAERRPP